MAKSTYLLYHNRKQSIPNFKIVLNGVEVPKTSCAKFLGVWLDDKLKWNIHANKLISKLKSGIGMMCRRKNLLSTKAKKLLYFGQIHSNLSYGLCIWGTMLQSSLTKKLSKIQKNVVRLIDTRITVEEMYQSHKILKFEDMVNVEQCKLGYKLCHDLLPKALTKSMTRDHQKEHLGKEHEYPTRNKAIPNLPNVTSNMYRSSFLFKSTKLYSELDSKIKNSHSLTVFVKRCKELYLLREIKH